MRNSLIRRACVAMGAGVVLVLAGGATSAYADANATNNSQSGGVAIAISRGDDNSINQSNTSSQRATCNQGTFAIGGGGREKSSSDSSSPGVGGSVSSSCHISQSVRQSNSIGGFRGHPQKVHAVKGTRTTVVSTQLAFTGRETPVLTAMGLLLAVLGAWLVVVSKRQPATAATA